MSRTLAYWCIGGPRHLTREPMRSDYFRVAMRQSVPMIFEPDAPLAIEPIETYLYQAKQWVDSRGNRSFCFVGKDCDLAGEETFIKLLLTVREGPVALLAQAQETEDNFPPWIRDGRTPLSIRMEVLWSHFRDYVQGFADRYGLPQPA